MSLTKKEIALSFQNLVVAGKIREAYDKYVHEDFVHHNPYFKGDRESLLRAMEEAHVTSPNKVFEVKHSLEDRDLVAVHSHVQQQNGTHIAVVHLFLFKDDKIIELWDVGQLVPENNPNESGMF